jgi:hypothetical protein
MAVVREDAKLLAEFILVDAIKARDLKIKDLINEIITLREKNSVLEQEKDILIKYIPDTHLRAALEELGTHSEFTNAEYFAGR